MSKLGNVTFKGKSGVQYTFRAYPLQTRIRESYSGVYIITERRQGRQGGFLHRRLGTGQGDNLRETIAKDPVSDSVRGGNCICVHQEKDAARRLNIQQDLAPQRRTA